MFTKYHNFWYLVISTSNKSEQDWKTFSLETTRKHDKAGKYDREYYYLRTSCIELAPITTHRFSHDLPNTCKPLYFHNNFMTFLCIFDNIPLTSFEFLPIFPQLYNNFFIIFPQLSYDLKKNFLLLFFDFSMAFLRLSTTLLRIF